MLLHAAIPNRIGAVGRLRSAGLHVGSNPAIVLFQTINEREVMLVLCRERGECIRIGSEIVVTLVRSGVNRSRIGIDAPRDVPVVRGELESFQDERRMFIDVSDLIEGARQAGVVSQLAMQLSCIAANVDDEFRSLLDTVVARLDSIDVEQLSEVE